MEFRTKIPVDSKEPKIDYNSKIFLVGSCFVENVGKKLDYFKFQNLINPFGILFHPAAIHNFLKKVQENAIYEEDDVFLHNEQWHSFEAHSDLNSIEKGEILNALNTAVKETRAFLHDATHVIITPGTAWGYRLKETGKFVANCHKVPQKNFSKELTEVKNDLFGCLEIINGLNPSAQVIFTVSPVRHLKDGFIENQQSKAKLITAIQELLNVPPLGVRGLYFPAYEIMMDELRDYRFYAEDMVHPNSVAIDYIWERFQEAWLSSEAKEVMKRIDIIQKGQFHRPFNEASEAHQKFRNDLQKKILAMEKEFPRIKF